MLIPPRISSGNAGIRSAQYLFLHGSMLTRFSPASEAGIRIRSSPLSLISSCYFSRNFPKDKMERWITL